jgi:hypothetical protein
MVLAGLGSAARAAAAVSDETIFVYDGKTVRVKVYSRQVGDLKNSPVFKYGDLVNRAIAYKQSNPSVHVEIKFAMYAMGLLSYVGFQSGDPSYGYVKGVDHGGDYSEKLAYSLVKAAKNRVHVDFVYQKDVGGGNVLQYLSDFMGDRTFDDSASVSDFLRVARVSWGVDNRQQMHAKFMTVNHYAGDTPGAAVHDTTYVSTSNVDDHDPSGIPDNDWVQSAVLINGHPELRDAYNQYFQLIFDNAGDQQAFRTSVRALHAVDGLNYDDQHLSAYFTPIPLSPQGGTTTGNAWDTEFNPVAKYVSEMATLPGNRYLKANVYHLKTDAFGQELYAELSNMYRPQAAGSPFTDFRFVVNTNSNEDIFPLSTFNNIGVMSNPKPTHAKNIQFAFSGIATYYTVTGSTNLKQDEHVSKANSSIVIKEYTTAHPVYSAFKEIFEYQF